MGAGIRKKAAEFWSSVEAGVELRQGTIGRRHDWLHRAAAPTMGDEQHNFMTRYKTWKAEAKKADDEKEAESKNA